MNAVHGRYLQIDLSSGTTTVHPLPETVFARLIGGVGLASYLLGRACPPRADPLGPENPLVVASSPFIGTGITTASKVAVAAKSPQTGMIGDSLTSSYLALALKRTGYDALVITGQAPGWMVLVVDDEAVRLLPGEDLLGLDPAATADAIRAELGSGFRVAAIGVAGERGVRYAAISNDGRLAGRTGIGAVMGSKRLKALAVRGSHRLPPVADPRGVVRAARELAERSLGPGTAKYRELGTTANLAFFSRLGVLPTRNFQTGTFEAAEAISGERLGLEHRVDRHGCAACTIGCEHHFRTRDHDETVEVRLEYESLFALGSLCGVSDPNAVLRAAALCDHYGMDTISAGSTVAWAMECVERGVHLPGSPDEWPRFGDADALLRTIQAIGERRGLGDLLAEGSRRAAEVVGQGSDAWAMHVKGLELPGYDPRTLKAAALGFAVSTRGACHNRSAAYEIDFSDQLDPHGSPLAWAGAVAASEDRAAVMDSLTLCKFLRHCFGDLFAEAAELFALVTGVPMTADALRLAGTRINTVKKWFNIAQGWTRADDTLPPRLLANEAGGLTAVELDRLIQAYYCVRGWDEQGLVPPSRLQELELEEFLGERSIISGHAG
jgi:aldehyde:ferredoxin oxidoreductase